MSKFCMWRNIKWGGFYDTECGDWHCFEVDGIKENKFKFCPYCGKRIKEKV